MSGNFFPGVVLAILTLQKVQGGELYLAIVGPPPLRFEPAAINDPVFTQELQLPAPRDTKFAVSIIPTNVPASAAAETALNDVVKAESAPPVTSPAAISAEVPAGPASNLLPTIPQMMMDYLKPNQSADPGESSPYQPGDTIFAPAELNFLPPIPGQSRAIYQSR